MLHSVGYGRNYNSRLWNFVDISPQPEVVLFIVYKPPISYHSHFCMVSKKHRTISQHDSIVIVVKLCYQLRVSWYRDHSKHLYIISRSRPSSTLRSFLMIKSEDVARVRLALVSRGQTVHVHVLVSTKHFSVIYTQVITSVVADHRFAPEV